MSWGRPAGFMGGEEEGALLPGPRRCDGCLQAFRGLATPSAAAGLDRGTGLAQTPAGEPENSEGRREGGWRLLGSPGVCSLGTFEMCQTLLLPLARRDCFRSHCLLIPSGCN